MRVVEGRNLSAADCSSTSDPYAIVTLLGGGGGDGSGADVGAEEQRTQTVESTLAPRWDASFGMGAVREGARLLALLCRDACATHPVRSLLLCLAGFTPAGARSAATANAATKKKKKAPTVVREPTGERALR